MKKLFIFLLLLLCGVVNAQAPSPYKVINDYIGIKTADSVLFTLGGSELWFTPIGIYWDTASYLDSLMLDSIINAEGRFSGASPEAKVSDSIAGDVDTLVDTTMIFGALYDRMDKGWITDSAGNGYGIQNPTGNTNNGYYLSLNTATTPDSMFWTEYVTSGLDQWAETKSGDTSFWSAKTPNTIAGIDDELTLRGNNITGVGGITMGGDINMANNTIDLADSIVTASLNVTRLWGPAGTILLYDDIQMAGTEEVDGVDISVLNTTVGKITDDTTNFHKAWDSAQALDETYLPLAGGTMTGSIVGTDSLDLDSGLYISDDITITGTVDGVDVSVLNTTVGKVTDDTTSFHNAKDSVAAWDNENLDSSNIKNATITEPDLKAFNAPSNGDIMFWRSASQEFWWQAMNVTDTVDAMTGTGIMVKTATDTWASRIILSDNNNQLGFGTGDGATGNIVGAFNTAASLSGNHSLDANKMKFGVNGLIWEGATADDIELYFSIPDPATTDKTITFPNSTGTVALTSDIPASSADSAGIYDGNSDHWNVDKAWLISYGNGLEWADSLKDSSGTDTGTVKLDDEYVTDLIGAMVSGNTETQIVVTYRDADNTIDFDASAAGDLEVYGNLMSWGYTSQVNHSNDIDIYKPSGDNADTLLDIPTYAWIDTTGLGDTCLYENIPDSNFPSALVHPDVYYVPEGWNGYRWLLVSTPTPRQNDNDSLNYELPTLVVSNNGTDFHCFIDSFSASPTYDSLSQSIVPYENYTIAGTQMTKCPDPDLMIDRDGVLWCAYMIAGISDSDIVGASYTSDGLTWHDTLDNGDYILLHVFDHSGANKERLLSPAWTKDDDYYYITFVETYQNGTTIATARQMTYRSLYIDSAYSYLHTSNDSTHLSLPGKMLWHSNILERGSDEWVYLMMFKDSNQASSGTGGIAVVGWSQDKGENLYFDSTHAITDTDGDSLWDSKFIYRWTAYWADAGAYDKMVVYYSAVGDSTNRFAVGKTEILWTAKNEISGDVDTTGTQISTFISTMDSTETVDGGLSEDDMNWRWEAVPFNVVLGLAGVPTDSIELTLPRYEGATVLFTDSTNQGSDQDTVWVMGTIPFAADSVDSIMFCYKGDGGANIDSILILGPDRSSGTNISDSLYYSADIDLTASSWTRIAYFVGASMDCDNLAIGDNFTVAFVNDLTTDEDWVKVSWVQMRVKR